MTVRILFDGGSQRSYIAAVKIKLGWLLHKTKQVSFLIWS